MDRKAHWENVYETKQPDQVSWTQEVPQASLDFIDEFGLSRDASVIDIGGGDSKLVDHLLARGYNDVTVLDISSAAIERSKSRLGAMAADVQWVVTDITEFAPTRSYDIWHDRATFHFLTTQEQIDRYLSTAYTATGKFMTMGTFSTSGPEKCSGLEVRRYDQPGLEAQLAGKFDRIRCITEDHTTPFGTKQNFLFCSFKKH